MEGVVDGHARGRRPPRAARRLGADARRELDAPPGRRAGGRGAPRSPSPGTARARGLLVVADTVKPTSAEAVARLRGARAAPGAADRRQRRRRRSAVAAEVGIDEVIAEVLPGRQGRRRAAPAGARAASWRWSATASTTRPALAQADLGLAIGTGTDVAIEASDLTLVSGDLRGGRRRDPPLARARLRTIKRNLFWAFALQRRGDPAGRGRATSTR